MGLFHTVQEKVADGADFVKRTGEEAVDKATEAGKAVFETTKELAVAAYDTAKNAAVWTKDKAVVAGEWVKDKAVVAGTWVRDKAVAIKDWGIDKAKKVDNTIAGAVAEAIAKAATKYKPVEQCIEALLNQLDPDPEVAKVAKENDGKFMGNDCPKSSADPPQEGRLPKGCSSGAKLPTVIYTNGIKTPPEAACKTMRAIADSRCVQVIGVYNATTGMVGDVLDSKNNIDRAGREKAAHSQARLIQEKLSKNPPEKVIIYAHSQGGLITQEGLSEASTSMKREMAFELEQQGMGHEQAQQEADRWVKERMQNVDVHSFGTAETAWPPVGANYYQMTNTSDPVPKLIEAVHENRCTDIQPTNLKDRYTFEKNEWDPFKAHSMDDTYLPKLNEIRPVPKKANGGCC